MKTYVAFSLTLTALIIWVFGYMQMDGLLGDSDSIQRSATDVWMLCDAISKTCVFLALVLITTRYFRLLSALGLGLCVNNLYDEIFLNPRQMGWPEWVIAILLSIYITINMVKMYGKPR